MNRKKNQLDPSMSLHEIKDKIQLTFTQDHAEFIVKNFKQLVDNTILVAPVRRKDYPLNHDNRHKLTPSVRPQEKDWEEAIFRKWKENDHGLDSKIPFRKIVSYQVMLRNTNKDKHWGELDLLGATAENIPVAIELKINPREKLLRAIIEVLAYGVAIRKAWSGIDDCTLSSQWTARTGGKVDSLVDLPLVVMAPASYWESVLSNSPKKEPFQTPLTARESIKKLLAKMHCFNFPLTFVEVNVEPQPDEHGLPVIINADVKDLPIPNGSRLASYVVAPQKNSQFRGIDLTADPDNADWIHIVRAERIARQVPRGKQIWKAALEEAGGSRSNALMVFYRLLREAGIEEPG